MNQQAQFRTAVSIVRKELSPDSAKIIRFSLMNNGRHRAILQETGFGIAIRNLLAKHGVLWEEIALCNVWLEILKKSVESIAEGHSESSSLTDSLG